MFASALQKADKFVRPVVVNKRLFSGKVESGVAAFIVVNDEGWILTAAHVFNDLVANQQHMQEMAEYDKKIRQIQSNPKLTIREKARMSSATPANGNWVTNVSYWWAGNGVQATNITMDTDADLAVAKLDPFDATSVSVYPMFKNSSQPLLPGTFLCRLGYPFFDINASFDKATGGFQMDLSGGFPIYPIEGMLARFRIHHNAQTQRQVQFIETTSPGLRGQSGGPVFDVDGVVWGVQSHTVHYPLGFSPTLTVGNQTVTSHQFLNAGVGSHPEEVIRFLTTNNIKFQVALRTTVGQSG